MRGRDTKRAWKLVVRPIMRYLTESGIVHGTVREEMKACEDDQQCRRQLNKSRGNGCGDNAIRNVSGRQVCCRQGGG